MLARLEAVIVEDPHRLLTWVKCRRLCDAALGIVAERYQRLRRLQLCADLAGSTVPSTINDLSRHYGFTNLHDFMVEYARAFGILPLSEGQTATDHA